ncbi:Sec-independent protein translocase protein TatB [Brackiella oedipodis]|uniref:Sec-independent protein translocase protein TatB n=1 Tax=Brackiella oedipodis TaxID=124225 RepID=UPI00048FFB15|nr:Sec-independent protein translocase protein TatB [Brackiella oedipodis]
MFGFSFGELMVIGVVALVVIGPERLPKVARTAGLLIGRVQRYVNDIKSDIKREIDIEDFNKFKDDITQTTSQVKSSFSSQINEIKQPFESFKQQSQDLDQQLKASLSPLPERSHHKPQASASESSSSQSQPDQAPATSSSAPEKDQPASSVANPSNTSSTTAASSTTKDEG